MWRLNLICLTLAFVAAVAFVWWIDIDIADPKPDYALETASARRARLDALLDREVRLEFENEPNRMRLQREDPATADLAPPEYDEYPP